jgi:hypothetical protein
MINEISDQAISLEDMPKMKCLSQLQLCSGYAAARDKKE